MKLLFVCTGNTCRSPMAQVIAQDRLKERQIETASRGLQVFFPEEANPHAKQAVKEMGLSLENHCAKMLEKADLKNFDYVFAMTEGHKQAILRLDPTASNVYTIKEFIGESGDIPDPYGSSFSVYCLCRDELTRCIEELDRRLLQIDEKKGERKAGFS